MNISEEGGTCEHALFDIFTQACGCYGVRMGRWKTCLCRLAGVSPLVGLGVGPFTVGHTSLKAASSKVAKHEKACSDNQHAFISFVFDTFGFLAPEAVDLLHRVQKIMRSNVMSPRSMNVVFTRIGFAIQKGLAAQLVARLPSIQV